MSRQLRQVLGGNALVEEIHPVGVHGPDDGGSKIPVIKVRKDCGGARGDQQVLQFPGEKEVNKKDRKGD
jgi:hypothetical protein